MGIIHCDFQPDNVVWDAGSKTFFPMDMDNVNGDYFDPVMNKKSMNMPGSLNCSRISRRFKKNYKKGIR